MSNTDLIEQGGRTALKIDVLYNESVTDNYMIFRIIRSVETLHEISSKRIFWVLVLI